MIEIMVTIAIFVVMTCIVCMVLAKEIYSLLVDIGKLIKKLLKK